MPLASQAVPVFAHRYGVSCQTCHTIIPELNEFGRDFRDAGYRWPSAVRVPKVLPLAVKINLAYTSAPDRGGLPKAIVDEVEFLSFGPIGKHLVFRAEQYWIDGGNVGKTRDAYVTYQSNPMSYWRGSAPGFSAQVGQFTLPLPNDPETMRPTQNHYAIFDQTVGATRFNFFNDGLGINAGYAFRFGSINALALSGHDPQSGLPTTGFDTMFNGRLGSDALSLWAYVYQGGRPLRVVPDEFVRRGFALTSTLGKSQASFLLQNGVDTSPFGMGRPAASSGGYLQEEWTFSSRWIGVARYDGASGPNGFLRSTTLSVNYRPYDRARLTIEDVYQTQPQTSHTFNAAWLFAY
jgi:hypothetical protein